MQKQAIKELLTDLTNSSALFRGIYDAKNGSEEFMYGMITVMEAIAYKVDEDYAEKFTQNFLKNMQKSLDKSQTM